jgi:hypothetical protein
VQEVELVVPDLGNGATIRGIINIQPRCHKEEGLPELVEYVPPIHLLQMAGLEAPIKHLELKAAVMA